MTQRAENPASGGGALAAGVLLSVWLVACDTWIKVLARSGCCDAAGEVSEAAAALWSVPAGCEPVQIAGSVELLPAARAGATPLSWPIPAGADAVWGLGLFAVATVISILVLRWRDRAGGDLLALGTLWAGVAIHGLPRLAGPGSSFTELQVSGYGIGIADFAIAWALLWLLWRLLAELRT